jgi:hypothetical protein
MRTTYEEGIQAQEELENKLREDPNIVSVGVVAETDTDGSHAGYFLLQVGVCKVRKLDLIFNGVFYA